MRAGEAMTRLAGLPATVLIALVRLYQITLSPWLGRQCRFAPTCSNYFIEAVRSRGAVRGAALGVWRVLRCNPFSKGGYDPVPDGKHESRSVKSETKTETG